MFLRLRIMTYCGDPYITYKIQLFKYKYSLTVWQKIESIDLMF